MRKDVNTAYRFRIGYEITSRFGQVWRDATRLAQRAVCPFHIITICLLSSLIMPAFGEKADRDKPINITANRGFEDNKKQQAIFEGNVVLTQGTLRVEADKIVVHRDKDGFDSATASGNPARLRQKRDGMDEYVEGFAQRIEFDGKQEIVQFFDKAKLTRGQDELSGNYIQYNSHTEVFQASGPGQQDASSGDRVRAVIQPKSKNQGKP